MLFTATPKLRALIREPMSFTPPSMGCSVLGRGVEPLVRAQFLEHPPSRNFGANHLKKMDWAASKTPYPPPFPTQSSS